MQNDYLNRHDRIQKLNRKLPKPCNQYKPIILGLVGLVILVIFGVLLHNYLHHPPVNKAILDCSRCHNRQKAMINYFRKSGNPTPEEMAVAVLSTKSPRLLAAMAVKGEKNTHYTVRKGGYKKRHAGAWQVNEKDWGRVPFDARGQALKTENILTELTSTLPIEKALTVYGGDTTSKYSNRVLAELVNVP